MAVAGDEGRRAVSSQIATALVELEATVGVERVSRWIRETRKDHNGSQ